MQKFIIFFILFFLASGCATRSLPRTGVQTFGLAADQAGRLGENEFVYIRNDIISMHKAISILDQTPAAAISYDSQGGPQFVARQMAACKALRYYGDILMRLSCADNTGLVQRSASLYLENLAMALATPPDEAITAAAVAIQTGCTATSDREKAIAHLAIASRQSIPALADMLQKALVTDNDSYLQQYNQTADSLQAVAMTVIDAGTRFSLTERQMAVDGYFLAEKARTRSRELGTHLHAVFEELKENNAALVRHAQDGTMPQADFTPFGRTLRQAGNMQEVLTDKPAL